MKDKKLQKTTNIYQIGMIEDYKHKLQAALDTIYFQKRFIKELEERLDIAQCSFLASDDCYYWTPEAWKAFKQYKMLYEESRKIILRTQEILEGQADNE